VIPLLLVSLGGVGALATTFWALWSRAGLAQECDAARSLASSWKARHDIVQGLYDRAQDEIRAMKGQLDATIAEVEQHGKPGAVADLLRSRLNPTSSGH